MAAAHDDERAYRDACRCSLIRKKDLDEGDINGWILNQVMAPNPFVRNMMSMMYLSDVNGLSRINYPKSEFMKRINFERLKNPDIPAHCSQCLESRQAEARIVFQSPAKSHERQSTGSTALSTPALYARVRHFLSSKER